MSKFTFSLPDGRLFELSGPADATVAQAEKILAEQLVAGSLVGLRTGDKLEPPGEQIIKFTLSRLDRGTAGVSDLPLLAINNGGIVSALPLLGNVQIENGITTADFVQTNAATLAPSVGPLSPVQVQAIVSQIAKSVDQPSTEVSQEKGVGKYGLNGPQLESAGMLKPGTSCRSLCVKSPADPNPNNFISVMRSTNVWTGVSGVTSVEDLLINENLQDKIQQGLVEASYNSLVETGQIITTGTDSVAPVGQVYTTTNAGVSSLLNASAIGAGIGLASSLLNSGTLSNLNLLSIGSALTSTFNSIGKGVDKITSGISNFNLSGTSISGLSNLSLEGLSGGLDKAIGNISTLASRGVSDLGGLLANSSKFGVDTATAWAKGLTPDAITTKLNGLAKQGQFAINFSDFKLPSVVAGSAPGAAFTSTINRQTVDAATKRILGSTKIPTPGFGGISIDSSLSPSLISQANGLVKGTESMLGQAQGIANSSVAQAEQIIKRV